MISRTWIEEENIYEGNIDCITYLGDCGIHL